jgi:hypothetical protein
LWLAWYTLGSDTAVGLGKFDTAFSIKPIEPKSFYLLYNSTGPNPENFIVAWFPPISSPKACLRWVAYTPSSTLLSILTY